MNIHKKSLTLALCCFFLNACSTLSTDNVPLTIPTVSAANKPQSWGPHEALSWETISKAFEQSPAYQKLIAEQALSRSLIEKSFSPTLSFGFERLRNPSQWSVSVGTGLLQWLYQWGTDMKATHLAEAAIGGYIDLLQQHLRLEHLWRQSLYYQQSLEIWEKIMQMANNEYQLAQRMFEGGNISRAKWLTYQQRFLEQQRAFFLIQQAANTSKYQLAKTVHLTLNARVEQLRLASVPASQMPSEQQWIDTLAHYHARIAQGLAQLKTLGTPLTPWAEQLNPRFEWIKKSEQQTGMHLAVELPWIGQLDEPSKRFNQTQRAKILALTDLMQRSLMDFQIQYQQTQRAQGQWQLSEQLVGNLSEQVEQTGLLYNGMLTGPFELFSAQQALLQSQLQAIKDQWLFEQQLIKLRSVSLGVEDLSSTIMDAEASRLKNTNANH